MRCTNACASGSTCRSTGSTRPRGSSAPRRPRRSPSSERPSACSLWSLPWSSGPAWPTCRRPPAVRLELGRAGRDRYRRTGPGGHRGGRSAEARGRAVRRSPGPGVFDGDAALPLRGRRRPPADRPVLLRPAPDRPAHGRGPGAGRGRPAGPGRHPRPHGGRHAGPYHGHLGPPAGAGPGHPQGSGHRGPARDRGSGGGDGPCSQTAWGWSRSPGSRASPCSWSSPPPSPWRTWWPRCRAAWPPGPVPPRSSGASDGRSDDASGLGAPGEGAVPGGMKWRSRNIRERRQFLR